MPRFIPDDYGWPYHLRTKDREGDDCTVAYAIEDEKRRMEHEAEFDFPYVSDGKQVHEAVIAQSRGS